MKTLISLLFIGFALTAAASDECRGYFPEGAFGEEAQAFVITAGGPFLRLHLDGPHRHDNFDWTFARTQTGPDERVYEGDGQFQGKLRIDLASCDYAFDPGSDRELHCAASFTTNVSGRARAIDLSCTVNQHYYPAPANPNHCRTHCI